MSDPTPIDPAVTLDVLQANVSLLAEKERLERERTRLLELDRMRTEFLARVSHDLRTPLNSIIGFSDLLLTGDGGRLPKRSVDYLNAIHRNGHALLGLINDLLDLSGMELGRMSVRPAPVDLADFLTDIRSATEPTLARASLRVVWPKANDLVGQTAVFDRRRMLQVMTNLLDNARRFTPTGGTVEILLDPPEGGTLALGVRDTGPGIPEHLHQALFMPLSGRPGAEATTRSEGTGLGLAIVKAIIDIHHGTIAVGRGHDGRGCTFSIRLPAAGPTP